MTTPTQETRPEHASTADRAAELLRSGELGRRLVRLAQLAEAAHLAQRTEQIVRSAEGGRA